MIDINKLKNITKERSVGISIDELILKASINPDIWDIIILSEGCLRHGCIIIWSHNPKYKSFVIKEIYFNEWSSDESIRGYRELPKKYKELAQRVMDGKKLKAWPDAYVGNMDDNLIYSQLWMINRSDKAPIYKDVMPQNI